MATKKKAGKPRSPVAGAIGGNIASMRAANGLTQGGLAKKVGVSVSFVSMLERGRRSPSVEVVAKFAKVLRVKPGALFE